MTQATRSPVARSVALGLIVFGATLVVLFGLNGLVSRRPAASSAASQSPTSIAATGASSAGPSPAPASVSASQGSGDPVILAAGDIADCSTGGSQATAALLDDQAGTVVALGDNAYPDGSAAAYRDCYAPTWGRQLDRTRPAPGDRDWATADLAGYLGYFGASATTSGHPWYSFDLGTWHVIVLDSDCGKVAGCDPGSLQGRWLAADLAASKSRCTLAIWHRPRFSSGQSGNEPAVAPFWVALHAAGADVVLGAHDADYERFAPQDASGGLDRDHGLREFVVGTGGAPLTDFGTVRPNSELRASVTHGVLKLTLHATMYDWDFLSTATGFRDGGTATCH